MRLEEGFVILKGRVVRQEDVRGRLGSRRVVGPVPLASQGECLEPLDPATGALLLALAAVFSIKAFDTEVNRADGAVGRRAVAWLAIQSTAALALGPQLTNPCSGINKPYRQP